MMFLRPLPLCLLIALTPACGQQDKPATPHPAETPANKTPEKAAEQKAVPGPASTAVADGVRVLDSWQEWVKQDTGPDAVVETVPDVPETNADPAKPARAALTSAAAKAGVLVLKSGMPFSAVKCTNAESLLDLKGYEIAWEAMRTNGSDFFSALTFPVGDWKKCVSVVNGGWGGNVVGVSNIGYANASENETSRGYSFVNGRYYDFTLQVTPDVIRFLINGEEQFKVTVKGKSLTMHVSEITKCQPLGFSAYSSDSAVRNVRIRKLGDKELLPDPDSY